MKILLRISLEAQQNISYPDLNQPMSVIRAGNRTSYCGFHCNANLGDKFGDIGDHFGDKRNFLEGPRLITYFHWLHELSGDYVTSYVMKSLPVEKV
ncbi:hypothetical protein AVEN_15611-1 [Araneus ventricosus]|uniref:Uncharacterized protein n=1 Tax=Araneus ventricosus TaxID=182803 RepID=A0A4Y2RCS6_ARAVE|nr:hypothetical protein AVEN_15611-1 [Araneus ventricosus]